MSKSRALFGLLSVAVLSTISYAAVADRINGPIAGGPSVALPAGVHRLAVPENDRGRVDPATQFGSILLQTSPTPSQKRALTQLLAVQQDRNSPSYHKWLTPEQWADRFGLSQNDIQKVTTWLKAQGFTIKDVARGRNWIIVSGSAAQVESAFGTEIHHFEINGEVHAANASVPKIPVALSGIVTGIRGLDDFHLRPRTHVRPDYYSSLYNAAFIAPGDLATLYDLNPLYQSGIDGTGQKFAIIGQTDIYLSDLNNFRSGFGFSPSITCTNNSSGLITACSDAHLSYVVAGGLADPGKTLAGDLSEADVDLEIAGSVARNAQLVYVNAPATFSSTGGLVSGGVWVAWYWAVDKNLAPVISMSYGNCEFGFPYSVSGSADETELQKANSEGITFVNSTGDSGSAECDFGGSGGTLTSTNLATQGLAVSYPASSPEVTGVGGTAIPLGNFGTNYWATTNATDGGSALSYVPEQPWNDDLEFSQFCQSNATNTFCSSGNGTGTAITSESTAQSAIGPSSTGGGASNCAVQNGGNTACVSGFAQPSWQTVSVSGQASARFSPDVSLLATPNFPGYIFCTEVSELGDTGSGSSCSPGGATGISNAIALKNPSLIGGTSISSPAFGGMVVLLNQYLGSAGLGNVNPELYSLAATPANAAFHPVASGDNNVYCEVGSPSGQPWDIQCPMGGVFGFDGTNADSTTSYNLVTGLGSLDVNNLAIAWKAMTTQPGFTLSSSSATLSATAGSNTGGSTITVTPNKNGFTTGPVTLACTGLPSGATCQFTPATTSTTSTLVIQTTASMAGVPSTSVLITGTDTTGTISGSTAVALTVSGGTQSFTLQSSLGTNGTLSVTRGTPGSVQLGVYSTDGFVITTGGVSQTALAVTYNCSGLPSEATCTFSPPSPTQAPGVTLSVATTPPTARLQYPLDRGGRFFYALLLPGLLGLLITVGSIKRPAGTVRLVGLILVLTFSTLWMASCGGGSSGGGGGSNPGTPTGSYTITVNATTNNPAISASTKFTLKVN